MLNETSATESQCRQFFFLQQNHAMFLKIINAVKLRKFSKIVFLGFHHLRLAFSLHCNNIPCGYSI